MAISRSFRMRLVSVVLGAALAPLVLSFLLHTFIHYQSLYQKSHDNQAVMAKYTAGEVRSHLATAERTLVDLNKYQTLYNLTSARRQELLSNVVFGQMLFHTITYFDALSDEMETVSRQSLVPPVRHQRLIKEIVKNDAPLTRARYSQAHYDVRTAEPLISIIVPVTDPQTERLKGYLVADMMLRPIWDQIAIINTEEKVSIFVIDDRGGVVAHRDPSIVLRKSQYEYFSEHLVQPGLVFSTSVVAAQGFRLGKKTYHVVVERDRMDALKPLMQFFWGALLVIGLVLPLVLLATREMYRYILVPIQSLTNAAKHIQQGDFTHQVPFSGLDEIGEMASAFNTMSARLKDATSSLEGEQSLRASLIDTLPDFITIVDRNHKFIDCNKAFAERVGRSKGALLGNALSDVYDQDVADVIQKYDERAFRSGESARYEYRIEWPDGKVQYLDSIKVPWVAVGSEKNYLISISRDITEYKSIFNSLRESNREFRLAIEKSPLPIILTFGNGDVEYFNPKFEELFGWTINEIQTAEDWWSAAYPDPAYRKRVSESWERAIAESVTKGTEIAVQQWRITCKDGSIREAEFRMVPLAEDRHLIVINDISERIQVEEELRQHRDHLEDLVQQRTRETEDKAVQLEQALQREQEFNALQQKFVSLVSHEFRTPLTIIDGAAQRLIRRKDKIGADEIETRANKVRTAVTRMTGLIDATLYASRLDAGKIEMQRTSNDIAALLDELCDRQSEISPTHSIVVEVDALPDEMSYDIRLIDQVFTNILSNAVKYTPQDSTIEVRGWQENGGATVTVSDHGIGIPKDELPHMFSRFFRASTSAGYGGTGLGLSVCKEFIDMHGGTISVESIEGEGSTFTVWLPIEA